MPHMLMPIKSLENQITATADEPTSKSHEQASLLDWRLDS